jgi:hypothetical protein
MITPLIALAPDIRGVCSTDGTFEITSNPRNTDNTIMNIASLFSFKKVSTFSISDSFI